MGYNTDLEGRININPPLNEAEIDYLTKFAYTRHMTRKQGPFYINESRVYSEPFFNDPNCMNANSPEGGQPGIWCHFIPTVDGSELIWDEGEKTYDAEEWIRYLIDTFLKPNAKAKDSESSYFVNFTFDHICNGELTAYGEDYDDRWKILVKDNVVSVKQGRIVYDD
jgi:hypothetical protein